MKKLLSIVLLSTIILLLLGCPPTTGGDAIPPIPGDGGASFTVNFNTNGGSTIEPISGVKSGETITLPSNPTKDMHTFIGWYTDNNTFIEAFTSESTVTADITVYAKWQADEGVTYTVTFDAKEGTPEPSPITNIEPEATVTLPTAPSKTDFDFVGWFMDDGTFSQPFTSETPVTASITVYAKWVPDDPNTHIVTFDSKGGSLVEPIYVANGGTIENLPVPTREGFTFGGWKYRNSWSWTISLTNSTEINDDLSVYAEWTCTVTFDFDDGVRIETLEDISPGYVLDNWDFPSYDDTNRNKHEFRGWYTDKTYTTQVASHTNFEVLQNTTLYAKWAYYVSFYDSADDQHPNTVRIENLGDLIGTPSSTKSQYYFAGWYTSATDQTEKNAFYDNTPCVGAIDLYAKFLPNPTEGSLKYILNEDHRTYSIAERNKNISGVVNIPTVHDEKPVVDFQYESSFADCQNITSFTVEDSSEYFSSVDGMLTSKDKTELLRYPLGKAETNALISSGITKIGQYAFYKNATLQTINFGTEVEEIGEKAFYENTNLVSLSIPNSVMSIGNEAFYENTRLASINFGDNVETIGSNAFLGSSVTEVRIPDSVTSIGGGIFEDSDELETVTIGDGLETVSASAFKDCPSLRSVSLGTSVKHISSSAFSNYYASANNFTTIEILGELETIGDNAFDGNESFQSIMWGTKLKSIGRAAFRDTIISEVTFPKTLTSIETEAFLRTRIDEAIIPDSVTHIGWDVFEDCTELVNAHVGSGITHITPRLFNGCTKLATVTIGGEVTIVSEYAFTNTRITEIALPDTVTSIGRDAFKNTLLTRIDVPDNVSSIGSGAFSGCTNLQSVTLGASLESIAFEAFMGCISLTSITIPENVSFEQSWQERIFSGCTTLQTVEFEGNVKIIPDEMFLNCTSLTSITLPNSVEIIGWQAFKNAGLTSITLPSSLAEIGFNAFESCNFTDGEIISLPSTIEKMGESVFYKSGNIQLSVQSQESTSSWDPDWHKKNETSYYEVTYLP